MPIHRREGGNIVREDRIDRNPAGPRQPIEIDARRHIFGEEWNTPGIVATLLHQNTWRDVRVLLLGETRGSSPFRVLLERREGDHLGAYIPPVRPRIFCEAQRR